MYDLHAHILPGLDDGAKSMEKSLEMARAAAAQGTKAIVATPHRKDVTELHSVAHARALLDELNSRVRAEGIELEVLPGMENHLDAELPGEIDAGRALPIDGARHVLIEMPFFGNPGFVRPTLGRIQAAGLVPVLAHPERIEAFQQEPDLLAEFVRGGMLGQITAGSLLGHFGPRVRDFTAELLRSGLAHLMASDTHAPTGPRWPGLVEGVEAAAAIVGAEGALDLVDAVPRSILSSQLSRCWPL